MPTFYTVSWPLFARLEAAALFPPALLLAGGVMPTRAIDGWKTIPSAAAAVANLGLTDIQIFWIATTLALLIPCLIVTIVVDRLLTVRKGFSLLSLVAIAAWAGLGTLLPDQFPGLLPASLDEAIAAAGFETSDVAAAALGGFAALIHLRPFVLGLRDHGDIAARLLANKEEHAFARDRRTGMRRPQDVYYRQTASFREWREKPAVGGLTGVPKESSAVKILWAMTWIGVIGGAGAAWLARNELAATGRPGMADAAPAVPVVAVPAKESQTVPPVAVPGIAAVPTTPLPGAQAAGVALPAAVPGALPAVQRPSELSASLSTANLTAGQNEAVAERGRDGHFRFDALINGQHVPFMFDTGATVVALRAEDAVRLGIAVSKLRYSAKVQTANGPAEYAPITIDSITVGNITVHAVPGLVGRPGMVSDNLLGQAFLARLAGYNVERGQLVLRGR